MPIDNRRLVWRLRKKAKALGWTPPANDRNAIRRGGVAFWRNIIRDLSGRNERQQMDEQPDFVFDRHVRTGV